MNSYTISIRPFGDFAVLVEWPNKVEEQILNDILHFTKHLKENHLNEKEWEMVPAYNSLALIHRAGKIDYKSFSKELKEWYSQKLGDHHVEKYLWELPVCYEGNFAADIKEVGEKLTMTPSEVVSLHTKHTYTVYGIGFLPGFMYLGGLPPSLEIVRRETPRLNVEKGSVGLAGQQTGIYPQESPGGWNIIGNCPVPLFNKDNENPCFVNVGDKIKFYAITKGEFDLLKLQGEVGIYKLKKTKMDA
ncbi:5-oxoprolinase subunit PxpB [Sediminicola arcticus]|uniref:5-oxoprolinase subunit PxpB n=1 Tax=Sediminicola arcticus TaxID=1574308 RepID=A0ABV2SU90_9FLAO